MHGRRLQWADISVVILLTLLSGAYALAQLHLTEEAARRARCASNLRQIGLAMLIYSQENRGQYPRTLADAAAAAPAPVWGTPYENDAALGPLAPSEVDVFHAERSKVAVKANDVTAPLLLLIRTQDIRADAFVCPSTGAQAWDFGGGGNTEINWSNWRGTKGLAAHLSYSYQNPYPTTDAPTKGFRMNNSAGPDWPLAADMNPGTDAVLALKLPMADDARRRANSPNHGGDGQNVVYSGGHVEFQFTALAGPRPPGGGPRDNIYAYGAATAEKTGDGIVGPSVSGVDSVLLPTAKDLGIVDAQGALTPAELDRRAGTPALFKPVTDEVRANVLDNMKGTYVRDVDGKQMTLRVTDKQLVGTLDVVTITYDYTLVGAADRRHAKLSVSGPNTAPTDVTLREDRGRLHVRGTPFFEGEWRPKRADPASK